MADIPIAGRLKSTTTEGVLAYAGEILYPDGNKLPDVVDGKDDKMELFTSVPMNHIFLANGFYSLGTLENQTLTFVFQNGTRADDMMYISFVVGDGLFLEFPANCVGLTTLQPATGQLIEMIGIWNVGLQKWLFSHRGVFLV